MEIVPYSVGQKYSKWATQEDGPRFNFDGSAMELIYGVRNPTLTEQHIVHQNSLTLAFCVAKNILFFLIKFNGFAWMDAPFYPNVYPQEFFRHTRFPSGKTFPLIVYTVNTCDGELLNIRACGLAPTLWTEFFSVCRSLQRQPELSRAEQKAVIDAVYHQYRTSEDMLVLAKPQWVSTIVSNG